MWDAGIPTCVFTVRPHACPCYFFLSGRQERRGLSLALRPHTGPEVPVTSNTSPWLHQSSGIVLVSNTQDFRADKSVGHFTVLTAPGPSAAFHAADRSLPLDKPAALAPDGTFFGLSAAVPGYSSLSCCVLLCWGFSWAVPWVLFPTPPPHLSSWVSSHPGALSASYLPTTPICLSPGLNATRPLTGHLHLGASQASSNLSWANRNR